METRYLRVRNFEKYQFYNSQNLKQNPHPHWIKLWYALMHDRRFYKLPDAHKYHVVGFFLLASQHDNQIPCDLDWIRTQMNATEKIDLASMLASRFIEWVEPDGPSAIPVEAIVKKVQSELNDVSPLEHRESNLGDFPPHPPIRKEKIRKEEKVLTARRTRAPQELPITPAMREWARENGITADLEAETVAMLDHHRGKGNLQLDWLATWRTWMRNGKKWGRYDGKHESAAEAKQRKTREASERLLARMAQQAGGDVSPGDHGTDSGHVPEIIE